MTVKEILTIILSSDFGKFSILFAVLGVIQIAPIKIYPLQYIDKLIVKYVQKINKSTNSETMTLLNDLHTEMGEVKNDICLLDAKITSVDKRSEKRDIIATRTRILLFADEIAHNEGHTREHYDEIMLDIKTYENYCKNNPTFENGRCVNSIKVIESTYRKHLENADFL